MEHLHEAYEKFKEEGFTILSVSLDGSLEAVKQFREERWPMPWLNAFSEGGFDSEAAKTFEVAGVPKVFLVGKKGQIIATERDLRGEELLQTLGKVFGEAEPGGEIGNQ